MGANSPYSHLRNTANQKKRMEERALVGIKFGSYRVATK
jgi:hypothetical protein